MFSNETWSYILNRISSGVLLLNEFVFESILGIIFRSLPRFKGVNASLRSNPLKATCIKINDQISELFQKSVVTKNTLGSSAGKIKALITSQIASCFRYNI